MSLPSAPSRARTPLILFLDFDGTLTEQDTIAALAAIPSARVSVGDDTGDGATEGGGAEDGRDDEENVRGSGREGSEGSGAGAGQVDSGGRNAGAGGISRFPGAKGGGDEEGGTRDGDGSGTRAQKSTAERSADFAALTSQYLSDLENHTQSYVPKPEDRATVEQELAWLESLRSVEQESIKRVEESGLFTGLTRETIWKGAFEAVRGRGDPTEERVPGVDVRPFAKECIQHVLSRGGSIHIISVNWSRTWIRAILAAAFGDDFPYSSDSPPAVSSPILEDLPFVDVAANELDRSGKLQGWNGRRILTAGDKVRVARDIIRGRGVEKGGCRSVYVGDSVTDLGALLEVDLGVCLRGEGLGGVGRDQRAMGGSQRELMGGLERCGVGCEWIGGWRGRIGREGKRLWWGRGFEEVWESGVLSEGWEGDVDGRKPG